MTVHSQHPERRRGESIRAVYSHAASHPVAEWSTRHVEVCVAVAVFTLTISATEPVLAALVACVIAVGMLVGFAVGALREAAGTCDRIIREVQAREGQR